MGLGIAKSLAGAGARLALVDCNPTVADRIADPIFGDSAIALVKDLAMPEAAEELIGSALDKLGHLDGLVNCAASSFHKPLIETTIDEFDRVIAVNQRAPYFLVREFAKTLGEDVVDPCVINIASVNAAIGNKNLTAYASTKGAVVAMGRAMAVELAPRIRVVTISPGAVLTTYTEGLIAQGEIDVERLLDRLLLKRFIAVDEIANLVVYLFGPSAQSITGSNWTIDGGVTAQ
jgi:NAD(P)-dependent dehydrogenase (short-subunit alcohol dehydrogenase family)